jgi:hypothetical protein
MTTELESYGLLGETFSPRYFDLSLVQSWRGEVRLILGLAIFTIRYLWSLKSGTSTRQRSGALTNADLILYQSCMYRKVIFAQ